MKNMLFISIDLTEAKIILPRKQGLPKLIFFTLHYYQDRIIVKISHALVAGHCSKDAKVSKQSNKHKD